MMSQRRPTRETVFERNLKEDSRSLVEKFDRVLEVLLAAKT